MNYTAILKNMLVTILLTTGLFIFFEGLSYYLLKKNGQQFPFMALNKKSDNYTLDFMHECCGYDEADPLLGWAMTEGQLKKRQLIRKDNNIYFENIPAGSKDTLDIFITGGSTSDVALMPNNWPAKMAIQLKNDNISYRMYIGAVGAYSSSQEVLKLLRDGLPLNPDIHISYCGANEVENTYFVSTFEQHFYENTFNKAHTSSIFPNLVFMAREKLGLNKSSMTLKPLPTTEAIVQWKRNMQTMKVLADGNHYVFMGILQPVAGIRKIQQYTQDEGTLYHVKQYQTFYPDAIKHITSTDYLSDFTTIFDTINMPFFDDCHVKDDYQQIISDAIYMELKKRIEIKSNINIQQP